VLQLIVARAAQAMPEVRAKRMPVSRSFPAKLLRKSNGALMGRLWMEVPRSANAEAEAAFAVVKGGSKPWRRSSRRMIDSDGCSSFTQTGSPVRQSPINDQKSKIRMESTRVLSRDWVGDYGGLERRLKRF